MAAKMMETLTVVSKSCAFTTMQNDKIGTEKTLCAADCFVMLTWLCRSISFFLILIEIDW